MLTEKLKRWQNLQREADRLARETEVLRLLQTVEVDVDDAVIARFTVPNTNWRRVVDEAGIPDDVRKKFYTQGKPYVSLRLK